MTKLEHSNSYELKCKKPSKDAMEIQLDFYKTMIANPMAEKLNDIINEMIKDTKDTNMRYDKITYKDVKSTLKAIASVNDADVIIDYDEKTDFVEALFYSDKNGYTSKMVMMHPGDLKYGWDIDVNRFIKDIFKKKRDDKETVKIPKIKEVRFSGPATIIFWDDNTKTVVKAQDEAIDYEKGMAMAIAKKALGNNNKYYNTFKKWLPEEEVESMYPEIPDTVTKTFGDFSAFFLVQISSNIIKVCILLHCEKVEI